MVEIDQNHGGGGMTSSRAPGASRTPASSSRSSGVASRGLRDEEWMQWWADLPAFLLDVALQRPPRPPGSASWWWGSTGKFFGRSTCRKSYISATRVGGHCHGDHCDHDQQLDHKVHNLLQTNQGEEFSLQLSSTCCCRNWRPWSSQLFSAVHQLLSEPPVWEFKFSEVLSNQAHTWSLLSLWTDLTLDFIRSIFLLKRSESVI